MEYSICSEVAVGDRYCFPMPRCMATSRVDRSLFIKLLVESPTRQPLNLYILYLLMIFFVVLGVTLSLVNTHYHYQNTLSWFHMLEYSIFLPLWMLLSPLMHKSSKYLGECIPCPTITHCGSSGLKSHHESENELIVTRSKYKFVYQLESQSIFTVLLLLMMMIHLPC